LGLGLLAPAAARADDFFVIVFGAQRPVIKLARYTHSWAVFMRVPPCGPIQEVTISWMPATGKVRPFALKPEAGRNFSLEESLQYCVDNQLAVGAWGPYQIQPDLWNRALCQKSRLESGQVQYKAFDFGSQDGTVSNCIHALSYLTREPGQKEPNVIVAPANWGESGSYWVALTYRPWFVAPCQTHPCLLPKIGLNPQAFTFYDLSRNPTMNPLVLVTQAALHTYLLPNRVQCCGK
jgi:hypothetical protein